MNLIGLVLSDILTGNEKKHLTTLFTGYMLSKLTLNERKQTRKLGKCIEIYQRVGGCLKTRL